MREVIQVATTPEPAVRGSAPPHPREHRCSFRPRRPRTRSHPIWPSLTPAQQAVLDACLDTLTGRLSGVVVTAAGTTADPPRHPARDARRAPAGDRAGGLRAARRRLTRPAHRAAGARYPGRVSCDETGQRLEMLLVMRWLEEGAADDGEVTVPLAPVATELGLDDDRSGLLQVMAALGELEERRLVRVDWGAVGRVEARVTLATSCATTPAASSEGPSASRPVEPPERGMDAAVGPPGGFRRPSCRPNRSRHGTTRGPSSRCGRPCG